MDGTKFVFDSKVGFYYRHTITSVNEILNGLTGVTHSHPQYEIYYLISGDVSYHVSGKTYNIEKGSILVLNAYESHSVEFHPTEDYERCVIEFTVDNVPTLNGFSPLSVYFDNKSPVSIIPKETVEKTDLFKYFMLIEQASDNADKFTNHIIYSYIINIVSQVSRCIYEQNNPSPAFNMGNIDQEYINQAIKYINNNINKKINVDSIAKAIGLSRSYLQHMFKDTLGLPITTYINQQKLHIAKYMLGHGDSLTDVANALGFQYYSTFSNNYKKLYGITPKASQKNNI